MHTRLRTCPRHAQLVIYCCTLKCCRTCQVRFPLGGLWEDAWLEREDEEARHSEGPSLLDEDACGARHVATPSEHDTASLLQHPNSDASAGGLPASHGARDVDMAGALTDATPSAASSAGAATHVPAPSDAGSAYDALLAGIARLQAMRAQLARSVNRQGWGGAGRGGVGGVWLQCAALR